MEKKAKTFFETSIKIERGKIGVTYLIHKKVKENGMFLGYIPVFDLIVSGNNEHDMIDKADKMLSSYINYYLKRESFNAFILQINKLGFKTNMHMLTMKKLLNRDQAKANFKNTVNNLPKEFENTKVSKNSSLKMAY